MDIIRIKITTAASCGLYAARDNDSAYYVFRLNDPAYLPEGTILQVMKWRRDVDGNDAVATRESDGELVAVTWWMFGGGKLGAARMIEVASRKSPTA